MQYNLISEDYLMHHGVKGMKWGVRHDPERKGRKQKRQEIAAYRNKQMSKYESKRKKIISNAPDNTKKIESLTKQAYALANKYNFDADDGGGGRTRADEKAGAQYMKIWDKIESLENEQDPQYSHSDHARWVIQQVLKKYGEKTLNEAYNTPLWKLAEKYVNSGSYNKKWKPWMVGDEI